MNHVVVEKIKRLGTVILFENSFPRVKPNYYCLLVATMCLVLRRLVYRSFVGKYARNPGKSILNEIKKKGIQGLQAFAFCLVNLNDEQHET